MAKKNKKMAKKNKNKKLAEAFKRAAKAAKKTSVTAQKKASTSPSYSASRTSATAKAAAEAAKKAAEKAAAEARRKANVQKAIRTSAEATKKAAGSVRKTSTATPTRRRGTLMPVEPNKRRQGAVLSQKKLEAARKRLSENTKNAIDKYNERNKSGKTNSSGVKTTQKYKTGDSVANAVLKGGTYPQGVASVAKESAEISPHLSDYGKKQLAEENKRRLEGYVKDVDKEIDKAVPKKSTAKTTALTSDEILRVQTVARMNPQAQRGFYNANPDLAKKVAKLTSKDYAKSAGVMGAMEALSPVGVEDATRYITSDKKGNSRLDERVIKKAKDSTAYKVGYGAGTVGSFLLGGGGGALEEGIKQSMKAGLKVGTKKVLGESAEAVTKKQLKNVVRKNLTGTVKEAVEAEIKAKGKSKILDKIVDNTWRNLKLKGKDKVKSVAASRAADMAVSTPLNLAEAVKEGKKEDGSFNFLEAVKSFGLNTAMDMVIGGAIDVGGVLTKGGNYKKLSVLLAKQNMGQTLTKSESKWLSDITKQIENETASKRLSKTVSRVEDDYGYKIKSSDLMPSSNAGKNADMSAIKIDKHHSSTDVARIQEYHNSANETLKDFVSKIHNLTNPDVASKLNKSLADVTEREAADIKAVTGVDVAGYSHNINGSSIRHIEKRHGKNGSADKSMAIVEDVARIEYVLKEYDNIGALPIGDLDEGTRKLTKVWQNSDQSPSQVIKYEKKIDGTYYVVEAVPDSKGKKLQVISAYIGGNKKAAPELMNMAGNTAPHLTSEPLAPSTASNSISKSSENVNGDAEVTIPGGSNATVTAKQKAEADRVLEEANGRSWDSDDVAETAKIKEADVKSTADEQIRANNPRPQEALKRSQKISDSEIANTRQTAVRLYNQADDDVAEIFEPWIKDGLFSKRIEQTQAKALEQAEKELDEGTLFNDFMKMDVETKDEHLFMARAKVLIEDLSKRAANDNTAARQLLEVTNKATEIASHGGRLLNATKLLIRTTPEGRLRAISKEASKLEKKFADRLKGEKLELSDEQISKILKANTDEEIEKVLTDVNLELWDKIPATWFEKFNEFRHFSMLFNPKTHIRNVIGNTAFKMARAGSDGIEILLNKAAKGRIEKLGGNVDMTYVKYSDIVEHKDKLDEIFETNYKKSGSKNRFIETTRPDGSKTIKFAPLNAAIQANYKVMDWEDVFFTLRPEYRKNYVRWCQNNGIDLNKLDSMTPKQKMAADAYALHRAEVATFRDSSKVSEFLIKMKTTTAGKSGIAKPFYRAANVAMESALPFVKTPVNIFRRTIDYSPASLLRATGKLIYACRRADADMFKAGLHHLSTGLTGTGVAGLGYWLASQDLITVQAGDISGDAYYDRYMGCQDYSLILNIGGKKHSVTIDWLAPMQTSLFVGAEMHDMFSEKGFSTQEVFDGLLSLVSPTLDMSFMSGAKDTIDMLMERAYREEGSWGDALMATFFGSIPQNWLNSFIPQMSGQLAGALDSEQRDTRSTKEGTLANSWEHFGRKVANRIPVLRNKILNPKIDRFGDDVETGNNVVVRFLHSFLNPSNVKEIKLTNRDRNVIDIYNHLPTETKDEKETKKYFLRNLTGNPDYDLGNGKQMSYDELYKYGKISRKEQTKMLDTMFGASSYKNMTIKMKSKEVKDVHWIAQTVADQRTYGSNFAAKRISKTGSEADKRALKLIDRAGVSKKEYVDFYIKKEKFIARAHDSHDSTKALTVAMYGDDRMTRIYNINVKDVEAAREYVKQKGKKEAFKTFTNAMSNVMSTIEKVGTSVSKSHMAIAAAGHKIDGATYTAMGIEDDVANMGYGLDKFGYTFDSLAEMKLIAMYDFDTDGSGSLKKSEIMAYIDSLGIDNREQKACVFRYFSDAKNPYGSIPNYLSLKNTSSSSSGSYRRSGSTKKKKASTEQKKKTPKPMSWNDYISDFLNNNPEIAGVEFKEWKSPLDKTYQNKIKSILKDKPSA